MCCKNKIHNRIFKMKSLPFLHIVLFNKLCLLNLLRIRIEMKSPLSQWEDTWKINPKTVVIKNKNWRWGPSTWTTSKILEITRKKGCKLSDGHHTKVDATCVRSIGRHLNSFQNLLLPWWRLLSIVYRPFPWFSSHALHPVILGVWIPHLGTVVVCLCDSGYMVSTPWCRSGLSFFVDLTPA